MQSYFERNFMFNKYIKCIIQCEDKNMIYYTNDDRSYSICEFSFKFIEPEKTKILYEYDEDPSIYEIDKQYKAKFNEKDGSFKVIKEL